MDVDEAVLHWAAGQIRAKLLWPPIGSDEGIRVDHYRFCPDLALRIGGRGCTPSGWKVDVWVTCPHGQVETNHGVTPLTPVMRTLTLEGLSADILHDLDRLQGRTHRRDTSS